MSQDAVKLDGTLETIEQLRLKKRNSGLILYLILIFMVFIIAILIYFAWQYISQMANNLDDLNQQVINLRENNNNLKQQKEQLEQQNEQLQQKNIILTETFNKVESTLHSNTNVKAAETLIKDADKKIANLKAVIPANTSQIKNTNTNTSIPSNSLSYRVYLQIVEQNQRVPVAELTKRLAGNDFIFPGIEFIENRKIIKTEIRYFRPTDSTKAKNLKQLLADNGIEAVEVYTNLKAAENVMEIWFANDAFSNSKK